MREGEQALRDIAHHPSTAKFIATKLARHFVADDPPADAIRQLEEAYIRSDGHLGAVSRELTRLDSVWSTPQPKIKTPYELLVSTLRALKADEAPPRNLIGALQQLGQPIFRANSPAGWSDLAKDWLGPESLMRRIELVRTIANKIPSNVPPEVLVNNTVATIISPETQEAIDAAPSNKVAYALLFASPEFQRR